MGPRWLRGLEGPVPSSQKPGLQPGGHTGAVGGASPWGRARRLGWSRLHEGMEEAA